MKKIFVFIISIILVLSLVACAGVSTVNAPSENPTQSIEPTSTAEDSDVPNMYIFIDDGDGGCYSLMSKGEVIHNKEYNSYEITLDDPALLAFKVSESRYPGGVGTMSGEEVNAMISSIETFLSENEVDENTKAFIENLLQQIKDIPVIEGAST